MRFESVVPNSYWRDIPMSDWRSWTWQQQRRVKSLNELEKIISLTVSERQAFEHCQSKFKMAVTPYYASLIDGQNPHCPIRLQSVPQIGELFISAQEMADPLAEESYMPVPGITHRYPDRVLFYTTHNCPVYCRHCTRKRKVSDPKTSPSYDQLEMGIKYIREHNEVRDVLVSGGDPLSFSDERLDHLLSSLRAIPHIDIIRVCTRNLVTLPYRVTDELAAIFKKSAPIYVHTHFNHPREITLEAFEACARLADAGCVLNNQMVLLRGVNDSAPIVRELNHKLLFMRVQPYYIFLSDMAEGLSHFRVPISKGLEIIDQLRGWTSGMAVPHLAVDLPGGGGKVTLVPEYLLGCRDNVWFFRNYQGQVFEYHDV